MRKFLIFFSLFLCSVVSLNAQNNIIPAPVSYENNMDMFMIDNNVFLDDRTNDATAHDFVSDFLAYLQKANVNTSFKKVDTLSQQQKAIIFELKNDEKLGDEGYELEVKELAINITANKPAGIFNGIQTLRQLMPREFESVDYPMGFGMLMGCKIVDYPRFGWRGLMLDVSRHFFTVDEVKDYLLTMSKYKFNVMHWHLTDDEGWRIEIKSLPKLTEVGAWRVPRHGKFGEGRAYPKEGEEATEGGFYTQEEIKDIVAYAKSLNITIVPEIDIPGHSMAALAAYPELSVDKEPKFVNPGAKFAEWPAGGGFYMLIDNTLNPTDEKVYDFVDKVMTEVAELFPSEYIHMGGDECYHGYWEKNPEVQKFMKKNKIPDSHALQSYFVTRVQKIINSKGKKMIGWDEILEGGLAECGGNVLAGNGARNRSSKKRAQSSHDPNHVYLYRLFAR
jgi:hexosaminidase